MQKTEIRDYRAKDSICDVEVAQLKDSNVKLTKAYDFQRKQVLDLDGIAQNLESIIVKEQNIKSIYKYGFFGALVYIGLKLLF